VLKGLARFLGIFNRCTAGAAGLVVLAQSDSDKRLIW